MFIEKAFKQKKRVLCNEKSEFYFENENKWLLISCSFRQKYHMYYFWLRKLYFPKIMGQMYMNIWIQQNTLGITIKWFFFISEGITFQHIVERVNRPVVQAHRIYLILSHTMDMLWEIIQWILPLYMKQISFQSKPCLFSHHSRIYDFCLKKLNVFSQHTGIKQINIWIPQNKSQWIEILI